MGRVDLDLDALAPEPKRVRLAGRDWLLPADLPLSTVARIMAWASNTGDDSPEALVEVTAGLRDLLLELFRVHQPDLDELPPMSNRQALQLLDGLYQLGIQLDDEEEPETGGAGPGKPGGTASSTRPRNRSRSSN